jgi:hypothetical protein
LISLHSDLQPPVVERKLSARNTVIRAREAARRPAFPRI